METLQRYIEEPKFYNVVLKKDRTNLKLVGSYAKLLNDMSIAIFDGNDRVVAAFASGEWAGVVSKYIPTTGEPVTPISLAEMSDEQYRSLIDGKKPGEA